MISYHDRDGQDNSGTVQDRKPFGFHADEKERSDIREDNDDPEQDPHLSAFSVPCRHIGQFLCIERFLPAVECDRLQQCFYSH